ncbi:hypothetical protein OB2597_05560 [Pseudooceanicola batsensis HTCC2597]|uniref:Uncharacterized protein n=1 Tax=Pseudooceanicola batsensis (strain ATCC BAA-863 / DSM 15984 / KCTC 12145 / HTCC2597) TaxID=252305 RepID=A3TSU7_PSEBH|nr:hypothetical protein OB2597_05560 [Pseudooceanicola batsensis HTCC2597]
MSVGVAPVARAVASGGSISGKMKRRGGSPLPGIVQLPARCRIGVGVAARGVGIIPSGARRAVGGDRALEAFAPAPALARDEESEDQAGRAGRRDRSERGMIAGPRDEPEPDHRDARPDHGERADQNSKGGRAPRPDRGTRHV